MAITPVGMNEIGQFVIKGSSDELKLSAIFAATADLSLSNTITETSVIPNGVGSLTLPPNFFYPGKIIRAKLGGIYSTPGLGIPSIQAKIKLGSTVLASVTTTALVLSASSLRFFGECIITCRTDGVSGTVVIDAGLTYNVANNAMVSDALMNGGNTVTIDTTSQMAFNLTGKWDAASTTRIAKVTTFILESLN